jgi:CheY-like chemotaxis protein
MSLYAKTILYVDDDPDDLAIFTEIVKKIGTGFTIREATDGVHALEILRQMKEEENLPCLIVLDINMPRMDGKQTLIRLQGDRVLSAIPVVLYSTSSSELDKTFSKAKNVELITKPINYDNLTFTVNRLLAYCKD